MKNGFTLLLALIVISNVLAIGLGVYAVIVREIELSGLGRESEMAFYAADSGIECALYWDLKKKTLSTVKSTTIQCLEQSIPTTVIVPLPPNPPKISFKITNFSNGACAKVVVESRSSPPGTTTRSYGYNMDCDSVSPRKVERGVEITY